MPGAWTTKTIKDAAGATVTMRVWDESGAGTGPFSFGQVIGDGTGAAQLDIALGGGKKISDLNTALAGLQAFFGSTTDARDIHSDATSITLMQVIKEISQSSQLIQACFGSTAFDLGSGTGGTRTLRTMLDTSQTGGKTATASFTCGTTAYAANDAVGASGAAAALTFANMLSAAGELMLTSAALEIDTAALISGESNYRLYLYSASPASALNDSAAWNWSNSTDYSTQLGFIDLGIPVATGGKLHVEVNGINKQITLSGTGVFAYLVSTGAYTPTARVFKITLHGVPA